MNLAALQPQQNVPPPPAAGQVSVPSQGAPAPSAAPSGPGSGSSMIMLLMFVPVILFMFLTNRSQQKKQKDLESKLKKGDRVVTQSGLVGKLIDPPEGRHAKLEIAPGVKVTILRSSIAGLDAEETTKTKDEPALAEKK